MTLITETGAGVIGAESYAATDVIDTYWTGRTNNPLSAAWLVASQAIKEGAAREATAYVDACFGEFYLGTRRDYEQGLSWPRTIEEGEAGYGLPDLPPQLVNVTCELAARAVYGSLTVDMPVNSAIKSKTETLGPITEQTSYEISGQRYPRYGVIEGMMNPVLNGSQPWAVGRHWNWR